MLDKWLDPVLLLFTALTLLAGGRCACCAATRMGVDMLGGGQPGNVWGPAG